jgi:hypothetical protein
MRKVLLATTALVAMNVTAAQADVSISGNQTFEMTDTGAATSWAIDGDVKIIGTSTTDSGLTLTAAHHINTSVGSLTVSGTAATYSEDAHVDDSYLDISGEFGAFRAGNTDDALDRMDGLNPANWDESGWGGVGLNTQTAVMASFIAPTVMALPFTVLQQLKVLPVAWVLSMQTAQFRQSTSRGQQVHKTTHCWQLTSRWPVQQLVSAQATKMQLAQKQNHLQWVLSTQSTTH